MRLVARRLGGGDSRGLKGSEDPVYGEGGIWGFQPEHGRRWAALPGADWLCLPPQEHRPQF